MIFKWANVLKLFWQHITSHPVNTWLIESFFFFTYSGRNHHSDRIQSCALPSITSVLLMDSTFFFFFSQSSKAIIRWTQFPRVISYCHIMILFFTNSSSYLGHLFSPLVTRFVLLSINVVLATLSTFPYSLSICQMDLHTGIWFLLMPISVYYSLAILIHTEINQN